jgi:NodT family efflux transporter outer membrane factor (OMF) lipoprotein
MKPPFPATPAHGAALALAASLLFTLGGCASPAGIAPVTQLIQPASVGLSGAAPSDSAAPLSPDWWQGFGDATLNELVARALGANPSLMVAQARLARAQAAMAGAQSADGPQLNGSVDVSRQHFSANGIYPPPLGGESWTLASGKIGGSWELDFFGRNRAAIEATLGARNAALAEMQAARLLLASQVARSYVQLGRLLELRTLGTRTLQQRDDMLALIKQRVSSGLDTALEQRQGEGALPETRQQIEQLDEQISLVRHALAALTAQTPAALDGLAPALGLLQVTALPATLPADLLGRRADIAAARWRVQAASSDVDSARAQFYPNVNLSAFVGLSSIGLDRLVRSGSEEYGAGPALHLPIFDSGRLRANLRGKTAELDAAVASYNGAVLDAVRDAADQIGSLRSIARQQALQTQALAAAESAYAISTQRYQAGLGGYLMVLNAETSVLNQRRQAADLRARALDTQIGLTRALGGGYSADAPAPSGS